MSLPDIVTKDEWLRARKALLVKEKELTRTRDSLSAERRRLPMVKIEKDYVFEGPEGKKRLIDLFEGRRQLIIDHFMFDPRWEKGCPGCSGDADQMSDGLIRHLNHRDTSYACISRAPIEKIERYKAEKGWSFPWYSSFGSDFNYDFGVTLDESRGAGIYNYRTREDHEKAGTGYYYDSEPPAEASGLSCFLRVGNDVYHTYSVFSRGDESVGGSYYWLDLTALGRQEEWEEPKGRVESARANLPFFED